MATSRLVLDTDVVIDHLRRRTEAVNIALAKYDVSITAISHYELLSVKFMSVRQQASLAQILGIVDVIPFDVTASEHAAQLWNFLRSQGQLIGVMDTHIAGICLSQNLPLLTRNTKHFQRVPELKIVSPQDI